MTNFDKNDENQIMCNLKLDSMPDSANEIDLEELISRSARRFRRAGLAIESDSIQVFSNEEFLASYEEDTEATIIIEETNLDSSDSQPTGEFVSNSENSNEQDGAIAPELEIFTSTTQPVTTSTSTSKIVIVEIPVDYSDPASEILESEYDFRYDEEDIIEDIEIIEDTEEEMIPEDDESEVDGDSDGEASPGFSSDPEEIVVEIDEDFEETIEDSSPDVFSETEEIIFYDPSEVFDSSSTASSSSDIDDNSETAETIILSEIVDESLDENEEGVIFDTDLEDNVDDKNVDTGVTGENGDEPKTISASDKETKKSDDPQTGAVSDDNDSTSMVLWAIILLIALVIIVG